MYIKERVIRVIRAAEGKPVNRRKLVQSFDRARRAEANQVVSDLIGDGFVNPLGTGHRGSPYSIITSATWPYDRCPMCGQHVNETALLPRKNEES